MQCKTEVYKIVLPAAILNTEYIVRVPYNELGLSGRQLPFMLHSCIASNVMISSPLFLPVLENKQRTGSPFRPYSPRAVSRQPLLAETTFLVATQDMGY
jgi:hypothetical protein